MISSQIALSNSDSSSQSEIHHSKKSKQKESTQSQQKKQRLAIASHGISITKVIFIISGDSATVRYELSISLESRTVSFQANNEDLNDEKSFLNAVPPGFSLSPIPRAFSHLRAMLMSDVANAEWEAMVTTTGWYQWNGKAVFVHAGGVIGSDNNRNMEHGSETIGTPQVNNIKDVNLICSDVPILSSKTQPIKDLSLMASERLSKYRLSIPQSKEEAQAAVVTVLELFKIGNPSVTYIAIPALFSAALRDPRFALFIHGQTGTLKTAFSLLLQSFFVPNVEESDCASFKSTENALRARFSETGNVAVVVDDYVQPRGARNGGEEARKAENFLRSIVNATGKERSRSDGTLRPQNRPRGLAIITGEQLPDGLDSLQQRSVNLSVDMETFASATSGDRPNQFDIFQAAAARGVFSHAMGGFIAWAANCFDELNQQLDTDFYDFSDSPGVHRRLLEAISDIAWGMQFFLQYAKSLEVCSEEEYEEHLSIFSDAIYALMYQSRDDSRAACPTEQFASTIQASMSSLRCHIEVKNFKEYCERPRSVPLELLGYTKHRIPVSNEAIADDGQGIQTDRKSNADVTEFREEYKPHGKRIGWMMISLT